MAKINGTDLRIYYDGNLIGNATECTLSIDVDLPDASDKDSGGWAENISGQRSWSMSTTCFLNIPKVDEGELDIFSSINTRATVELEFKLPASPIVIGAPVYAGTARVTSLNFTSPNEDVASFDVDFTGTGALTRTSVA